MFKKGSYNDNVFNLTEWLYITNIYRVMEGIIIKCHFFINRASLENSCV